MPGIVLGVPSYSSELEQQCSYLYRTFSQWEKWVIKRQINIKHRVRKGHGLLSKNSGKVRDSVVAFLGRCGDVSEKKTFKQKAASLREWPMWKSMLGRGMASVASGRWLAYSRNAGGSSVAGVVNQNAACHVSKQSMLQPSSYHIIATQIVNPEGAQASVKWNVFCSTLYQ